MPDPWPALMDEKTAAAYLGLRTGSARAVLLRWGVTPLQLGLRLKRWRRADLDAALARAPVRGGPAFKDSCAPDQEGVDLALAAVSRRIATLPRSRNPG